MMDFKQWLISEMIVHKWGNKPNMVIAFRGNIWVVNSDGSGEQAKKIFNIINKEVPEDQQTNREFNDMYDLGQWLKETIYDVLVSWYRDGVLNVDYEDMRNIRTSPLIKKVADALKVKKVDTSFEYNYRTGKDQYGDKKYASQDINREFPRKKLLGNLPKIMFHGTSSKYLDKIMRFGLMPGESPSNYPKVITHNERVFLAAWQMGSMWHADNTVDKVKGVPVIIGFEIPDLGKIEPDYDVDTASATGNKTYGAENTRGSYFSVSPEKAIKHSGLIAYHGRIPANFIRSVSVRLQDGWKRFDINKLRNLMKRMSIEDVLERYGEF